MPVLSGVLYGKDRGLRHFTFRGSGRLHHTHPDRRAPRRAGGDWHPAAGRVRTAQRRDPVRDNCSGCHSPDDARAPSPEVLRGRSPQAIIDALTAGSMKYQGLALSGERAARHRRVPHRPQAARARSRAARSATAAPRCGGGRRAIPRRPAVERVGTIDRQHALAAGRSGGADRRAGPAAASQMGVRISRRDLGVGAADHRRRTPVRRQPERHRLLARRGERLRRVDVRRAGRRARLDLDRLPPSLAGISSGFGAAAYSRVLLRSEGFRLRARRGDGRRSGCGRSTIIRWCA